MDENIGLTDYTNRRQVKWATDKEIIVPLLLKIFKDSVRKRNEEFMAMIKVAPITMSSCSTAHKSHGFGSSVSGFISKIAKEEFGIEIETSASDDSKPDMYFVAKQIPMEIKVTSGQSWTGGELSNRPYPTILISYDAKLSHVFACIIPRIKYWKSNLRLDNKGRGSGRYGTSLLWEYVKKYESMILLCGGIDERGNMVREKI
jgi:hypothetical protein